MAASGVSFGAAAVSWAQCLRACRDQLGCNQVTWHNNYCYPMTTAKHELEPEGAMSAECLTLHTFYSALLTAPLKKLLAALSSQHIHTALLNTLHATLSSTLYSQHSSLVEYVFCRGRRDCIWAGLVLSTLSWHHVNSRGGAALCRLNTNACLCVMLSDRVYICLDSRAAPVDLHTPHAGLHKCCCWSAL